MLTVGSLFSGIGGLELGLERTGGFETRWQCEINEYARKVLAKNWPGLPIYSDVKELYRTEFPGRVDVLCGGFPCQPFSTAGKRRGEKDERFLWPEFVRIVREVRPRWVIAENVPGLLTIDAGRTFGRILTDLASCGYSVEWDTISAASVGALHPRNRIFIVGRLCDTDRTAFERPELCGQPSFENASGNGDWGNGEGQTVLADSQHPGWDATEIEGGFGERGHDHQAGAISPVQPSGLRVERSHVADADRPGLQAQGTELPAAGTSREDAFVPNSNSSRRRQESFGQSGSSHPSIIGNDGETGYVADAQRRGGWSGDVRRSGFERYAGPLERGWRDQRLRAFFDASREWWTIEPDVGRVANGVPRRVDRLRCLGNAVVPQCAQYIGECILEFERNRNIAG